LLTSATSSTGIRDRSSTGKNFCSVLSSRRDPSSTVASTSAWPLTERTTASSCAKSASGANSSVQPKGGVNSEVAGLTSLPTGVMA